MNFSGMLLFSLLKMRSRENRPHKTSMNVKERESLNAKINVSIVYKSEEDLKVDWHIHRGQKLIEQNDLPQLFA